MHDSKERNAVRLGQNGLVEVGRAQAWFFDKGWNKRTMKQKYISNESKVTHLCAEGTLEFLVTVALWVFTGAGAAEASVRSAVVGMTLGIRCCVTVRSMARAAPGWTTVRGSAQTVRASRAAISACVCLLHVRVSGCTQTRAAQ